MYMHHCIVDIAVTSNLPNLRKSIVDWKVDLTLITQRFFLTQIIDESRGVISCHGTLNLSFSSGNHTSIKVDL